MTLPNWTPPLTKLRLYEAVYFLNRSFETAIDAVDRLERLKFFANDYLPALKTQVEYLRAEANSHLMENLQEYEEDEAYQLDKSNHEREKELGDPDDGPQPRTGDQRTDQRAAKRTGEKTSGTQAQKGKQEAVLICKLWRSVRKRTAPRGPVVNCPSSQLIRFEGCVRISFHLRVRNL